MRGRRLMGAVYAWVGLGGMGVGGGRAAGRLSPLERHRDEAHKKMALLAETARRIVDSRVTQIWSFPGSGPARLTGSMLARPRIFVSSTYYDLKHIRSSLELFIESVGYEPVLSEKGDIAYMPDAALDESCYREAASADIFVLVIGGRYGAEVSGSDLKKKREFFERYDSITKKEFETAYEQDIPVFVLIESGVNAEYRTYLKNRDNEDVRYAHVDSVNVFRLIEYILNKPRNNPVFSFEKSSQIEGWLREQWSGLFRELLRDRSQQRQLLALTGQVSELKAANETLKNYLEVVLKGIAPDASSKIIADEEEKFHASIRSEQLKSNRFFEWIRGSDISEEVASDIISKPKSFEEFLDMTYKLENVNNEARRSIAAVLNLDEAQRDLNSARSVLGSEPLIFPDNVSDLIVQKNIAAEKDNLDVGVVGKPVESMSRRRSHNSKIETNDSSAAPKDRR